MKKLLATLLVGVMALSMVACGNKNSQTSETPAGPTVEVITEVEKDTLGATLLDVFSTEITANSALTAQELADTLITNEAILFSGMAMPMEEGFLMGFDADIKGFEQAVAFAPMIGTIPFIGYVFDLADDADVAAFTTTLEENANLRWNICTAAEQMVIATYADKVFFLMCPNSLEG
jgi:hypothetical protein